MKGIAARALGMASLALLVFLLLGPLTNLILWSVAERWYAPYKLPVVYGLKYWEVVFRPTGDAMTSLVTSIAIAVLVVVVALAVSVPAGYALARLKLPWRTAIMIAFLLPQAFPSLAIYINVARIFYTLGLAGTILGVVLVHAAHALVYSVWITTAAFAAIDRDLELAARNIGASALRAFWTVTLPSWRAPSSCSLSLSMSSRALFSSACLRSRRCRYCSTTPAWGATIRSPRLRRSSCWCRPSRSCCSSSGSCAPMSWRESEGRRANRAGKNEQESMPSMEKRPLATVAIHRH